jgi:hypothetical protein
MYHNIVVIIDEVLIVSSALVIIIYSVVRELISCCFASPVPLLLVLFIYLDTLSFRTDAFLISAGPMKPLHLLQI